MARFPGATWRPLPENATQSRIVPTQIILHTAVDAPGTTDLQRYFARSDVGVESHFWIPLDGEIVQMMDTEARADANYRANRRPDGTGAISIETEDEGDPVGVPWTAAQLTSVEAICRWAAEVHGIPLRKVEGPDDPGLGYHALFGAPSAWTPARGKTCPGETRIKQFHDDLLPRFQEELTMNENAAKALAEGLYEALLLRAPDAGGLAYWTAVGVEKGPVALMTGFIESAQTEIRKSRAAAAEKVAELEAEIRVMPSMVAAVDVDALAEQVADLLAERLQD